MTMILTTKIIAAISGHLSCTDRDAWLFLWILSSPRANRRLGPSLFLDERELKRE